MTLTPLVLLNCSDSSRDVGLKRRTSRRDIAAAKRRRGQSPTKLSIVSRGVVSERRSSAWVRV